jgi:phosphoribosylformylglycinamidine synthase PurS subunit
MKARVYVTLKNGVLDPQGKAIHHALEGLGFGGVAMSRAGKLIELDLAEDVADADSRGHVQAPARQHRHRKLPDRARVKSAVIVFPGSNCDRDLKVALREVTGQEPVMVWHRETELPDGIDLIGVPGGFLLRRLSPLWRRWPRSRR